VFDYQNQDYSLVTGHEAKILSNSVASFMVRRGEKKTGTFFIVDALPIDMDTKVPSLLFPYFQKPSFTMLRLC
jgi:hypothetical protein